MGSSSSPQYNGPAGWRVPSRARVAHYFPPRFKFAPIPGSNYQPEAGSPSACGKHALANVFPSDDYPRCKRCAALAAGAGAGGGEEVDDNAP